MFDLFIDMTLGTITRQTVPEEHRFLGGRGLIAAVASKQIPPDCAPLGPENRLIIAPGLFAGKGIPSAQRLSVGAKSPLTNGLKESNAGGTTARALAELGIKTAIISGKTATLSLVILSPTECRLNPVPELAGLGCYQTAAILRQRYGHNIAALLIGPSGEYQALAACALNLDYQGRPSRANGRGGLGAVLGSKGIKAIVVIPPEDSNLGESAPASLNLRTAVDVYCSTISASKNTHDYREYGTALTGDIADALGCLPTRNFHQGSFAGKSKILGKTIRNLIDERGGDGNPTHTCNAGCIIACSNVFPDPAGHELVSPLDYEAIASLGSNLCIDNIDEIAELYRCCNDLGIDVIEAGTSLALLMDEGLIPWGSGKEALRVLAGANSGEYPGYLIANGLAATAKHLGVKRIAAVKGQAFAAFDPRAIKGLGVTYATSPQAADHTAGHTIRKKIDHHKKEGQIELSMKLQIETALYDTLGICFFATGALANKQQVVVDLFNTITEETWSAADLLEQGRKTIAREYRFNHAVGYTDADNRLPDFCYTEPLPPSESAFDIDSEQMQAALETTIL